MGIESVDWTKMGKEIHYSTVQCRPDTTSTFNTYNNNGSNNSNAFAYRMQIRFNKIEHQFERNQQSHETHAQRIMKCVHCSFFTLPPNECLAAIVLRFELCDYYREAICQRSFNAVDFKTNNIRFVQIFVFVFGKCGFVAASGQQSRSDNSD